MNLTDVKYFLSTLWYSSSPTNQVYWNETSQANLDKLINLLRREHDPEKESIRHMVEGIAPRKFLDIGCGPVGVLSHFIDFGVPVNYTGIDGSPYFLKKAKAFHPDAHLAQGNICQLPFRDKTFDAVLLKHVLEHQRDYVPVLEEAGRVASKFVIVDFFHRLLPGATDCIIWDKRGYWNNWYSRQAFEQRASRIGTIVQHTVERGLLGQSVELYMIQKA